MERKAGTRAAFVSGRGNRLLESINRGEFAIHGLRNRDLQQLLYDTPAKSKVVAHAAPLQ
jgi:hypothetical protein